MIKPTVTPNMETNQSNQPDDPKPATPIQPPTPPTSITFRAVLINTDGNDIDGGQRYFALSPAEASSLSTVRQKLASRLAPTIDLNHYDLFANAADELEMLGEHNNDDDWNLGILRPFLHRLEEHQREYLSLYLFPHRPQRAFGQGGASPTQMSMGRTERTGWLRAALTNKTPMKVRYYL